MTPTQLGELYATLRVRVSRHSPIGCVGISLPLPTEFAGELAFYRLINWGYALVHEAVKVPLDFLTRLPPFNADNSLRKEVATLRTYLVHNLDIRKTRDRKTYDFVYRWFTDACGSGTPASAAEYGTCCSRLAGKLHDVLQGAIEACDLLDDPEDGPRLVADLIGRIDLAWEAHRFDPLVEGCAARLGNPGLDLLAIRKRHLEKWRRVLSAADANDRARVLEQQIEADLLGAIGDALPLNIRENLQRVAANTEAIVAALLLLQQARRFGTMTLPEIISLVSSQALADSGSQTNEENAKPPDDG